MVPLVAGLSVLMCLYLMLNLTGETWERFVIWMAIGFVVYFAYGRRHSRLSTSPSSTAARRARDPHHYLNSARSPQPRRGTPAP